MRLLDQIWQWREPFFVDHPELGRVQLPGVERLAGPIANAELRYVLNDEVARACASLIYDQPDLLLDSIDLIRMPAETMWIEWFDSAIVRPGQDVGPINRRAGVYVLADPSGRIGTLRPAWEYSPGRPDRSPAEVEFDLDAIVSARCGDTSRYPVRPCYPAIFKPLGDQLRVNIDYEWAEYYRAVSLDLNDTLEQVKTTVAADALFLFAFCLLLSMRTGIDYHPSDLERLNRARSKRRQPPLLDYREVSTKIFSGAVDRTANQRETNTQRATSRLHFVRGHFVRRNAAIFWRSSHLRGDVSRGIATRKIVTLGLGPAPTELRMG